MRALTSCPNSLVRSFSLIILIGCDRVPPGCVSSSFSAMLALSFLASLLSIQAITKVAGPLVIEMHWSSMAITAIINTRIKHIQGQPRGALCGELWPRSIRNGTGTRSTRSVMDPSIQEASRIFLELGASIVGLAILGQLSSWVGFLNPSRSTCWPASHLAMADWRLWTSAKASFNLGQKSAFFCFCSCWGWSTRSSNLRDSLSRGSPAEIADFVLNFPPGLA